MWRPLAVVGLVLLAGCSGFLGTDAGGPDRTVTPAPLPETPTDRPVELPRANGSVDLQRVLVRHDTALAGRNFHRRVVREGPRNTRDVWVDRDADIVRVRRTLGPVADDAVVADGTLYRSVSDDPNRDYFTTPSDGSVPYVSTLSGVTLLRVFLTDYDYERVGTVTRNDRTLAVLSTNDTDVPITAGDPDQTVAVRSRVYVDRGGVVRYVDHYERDSDGTNRTVQMRVTTGTDRIAVPWWLADVDIYAG
ncbi:hypothetical protein ACFQL1_10490 [Halomicroarcula sp. GCM10025709]|uniref:hypothetical protein n=1 Tax=Haloarcula TaxID=2237 RepID=UPI0024C36A73|nr:hypothetical protein [Halomicroarcula sp. YJ-61-S]